MTMLKRCPFCGRPVGAYAHWYFGCPVIEHTARGYECVFDRLKFYGLSLEKAIELWNRRVEGLMEDDLK